MLDTFDQKILKIIQTNNLTPQRDIGEKVGLSAAAVQRRIKKMREQGGIEKDISVIDRQKIGNNVTILVELFLNSEQMEIIDNLKKKFKAIAEIQQCYYITGESDFFLVIVVPSMAHYEELTRKFFFGDENIKRFRTIVVMGITKNSLELPLNLLIDNEK